MALQIQNSLKRSKRKLSIFLDFPDSSSLSQFDEVIGVYAKHHKCSLPKDKVYSFRELVPQWKENLVVDYKRSDLEVFLDVAKLDLFEPKKHRGWHLAFHLWLTMGLGDCEKFNDCLQQSFPKIYCGNESASKSKRINTASPAGRAGRRPGVQGYH